MGIADRLKLAKETSRVRVLTIDIESKPHTAYVWGLWDQNVSLAQLVEAGGMICFAAKWMGEKEVIFKSVHHDGYENMLQAAWDLLSEAHVIITYNGVRYDVKRLNNEFMLAGMGPPKPFKHIDLIRTNKARFDLPSRKLDYLVQSAGVGKKLSHTGFDLWVDCMAGDPKAWELMRRYNVQDVKVTEAAFLRLLPWITDSPHFGMFTQTEHSCPYCGGKDLTRDGETYTNVQSYALYRCGNCKGWSRGNRPMQEATHTRALR